MEMLHVLLCLRGGATIYIMLLSKNVKLNSLVQPRTQGAKVQQLHKMHASM